MMKCMICYKGVDRYNSIWFPERSSCNNQVYPLCFDCTDNIILVFGQSALSVILSREISPIKGYKTNLKSFKRVSRHDD